MPDFSRPLSRMALAAVLSASFAGPSLLAQATGEPAPAAPPAAAAAPMEFDVVSVKPNTSENGMMRVMNKPGIFTATNVQLKMLIQQAYNIRTDLISGGPGWLDSSSYDIEGKIAPADADALKAMTNEQRTAATRQMMQHLLADRFKLKVHIETKTLPVYELVLAKGGSKMKEADPNAAYPDGTKGPDGAGKQVSVSTGGPNPKGAAPNSTNPIKGPDGVAKPGMMRSSRDRLDAQSIPVSSLVSFLSSHLEHTVIDKTGLTGKYDIVLNWKPEDGPGGQDSGTSDSNAPDFFTAVQEELGLKLVSAKGPVDTLVIDSAEKPAEN